MSGKYDVLIAEADGHTSPGALTDVSLAQTGALVLLVGKMATALREAQAHVPPERWRVTEWEREDGLVVQPTTDHQTGRLYWRISDARKHKISGDFTTAAAAMAAIEESGK